MRLSFPFSPPALPRRLSLVPPGSMPSGDVREGHSSSWKGRPILRGHRSDEKDSADFACFEVPAPARGRPRRCSTGTAPRPRIRDDLGESARPVLHIVERQEPLLPSRDKNLGLQLIEEGLRLHGDPVSLRRRSDWQALRCMHSKESGTHPGGRNRAASAQSQLCPTNPRNRLRSFLSSHSCSGIPVYTQPRKFSAG
jgi:hypothetical protein